MRVRVWLLAVTALCVGFGVAAVLAAHEAASQKLTVISVLIAIGGVIAAVIGTL